MTITRIVDARVVLPDQIATGAIDIADGRIAAVHLGRAPATAAGATTFDAAGDFIAPGFIDMHVHGGDGHDFMDGTEAAFDAIFACHRRHGVTGIVPTNTVARHDQVMRFLDLARTYHARRDDPPADQPRVVGSHLYGPYFAAEKIGCHPRLSHPPTEKDFSQYLAHADHLLVATCAPELPGASDFYRAARAAGVRLNAGHSNATWAEMHAAFELGVRHVDHFFCAMSNYVSTRARVGVPMQPGMFEYVLASDAMTTELIADGRHLSPELMRFALKMLGVERTALVSDASRAVDTPPGPSVFGPLDGGEPFYHDGEVGLTEDRTGLASSARGLDFMVKHMVQAVGVDVATAVRMATLTPATILGIERDHGSLEVGKFADLVVLSPALDVKGTFVGGR